MKIAARRCVRRETRTGESLFKERAMAQADQVFGFFIPTVSLMGIGSHKEIGKQVKVLGGKKPFICTDKGITKCGIAEQIATLIKQEIGVAPVIFDETVPNPTDTNVGDGL